MEAEVVLKAFSILGKLVYDVTFRGFDGGHTYPPDEIISDIAEWF